MNIERTQGQQSRFGRRLSTFVLLVVLTGFASVAGATYSLPTSRSVTWQGNVGVSGDIPTRTTIYKTLSPSGGDDTSAIQTAINNCPAGQVVKLNAGTFKISSLTLGSNVTLRGSGMGTTILQGQSTSVPYLIYVHISESMGTSANITSGLTQGSTTITTATAHGWSAGDVILIDQLNNASADPPVTNVGNNGANGSSGRSGRALGQVVKIQSVPDSTHATLEVPLYWNFNTSLTPQGTKFLNVVVNTGVEDLTVDNSISGSSSQDGWATVELDTTANCWLLRVDVVGSYQAGVRLIAAYRNTVRGCKVHEGIPTSATDGNPAFAPSRAYGIALYYYNSANLIEDNQIYHEAAGLLASGANSGNVFAYNYIAGMYYSDANWLNYPFTFHGAHAMMNLIEGNYVVGRINSDDCWGSSSHNTFFRNRQALPPNKLYGTWNFNIEYHQQYFNFVGNVIGTPGVESSYELNNVDISASSKTIYRFGYDGDGDLSASGNDPAVDSTSLRHGNWDSVTNGVVWNGNDDRVLPASLYLASKPSWWGSVQWPAIGPDVSPMYPAAGTVGNGAPWDRTTFLSPPTNLAAQ